MLVEKPKMTKRVAVYPVLGEWRNIIPFDGDKETAELLNDFGKVVEAHTGADNHYWLVVDQRFDMADVLDYMHSMNEVVEAAEK